jgi:hypothetical protein
MIKILTINVASWATDLFTSVSCPFISKSDQRENDLSLT